MLSGLGQETSHRAPGPGATSNTISISNDLLRYLITAVVSEELARVRAAPIPHQIRLSWNDDTDLGADGLGFDSLALLEVVTRLNQMFSLHRTGVEDYLFIRNRLGDWVDLVGHHLATEGPEATGTFRTSGSTGAPKPVIHRLTKLASEVTAMRPVLGPVNRVVSMVPPFHIYGFLWTVLMPSSAGIPTLDHSAGGIGTAIEQLRPDDLLVATPTHLKLVGTAGPALPSGIRILTSAGAMAADEWRDLADRHSVQITELFGSTETGGLGYRISPDAEFTLMAHLDRENDAIADDQAPLPLQDRIQWVGERRFIPLGRLDAAIKLGGNKVYPDAVVQRLLMHPGVAEAAVRPNGGESATRLKCVVVPSDPNADIELLERDLRHSMANRAASEQPSSYTFAQRLPRNSIGKTIDW